MHKSQLCSEILNAARKGGAEGRTLADILKEISPARWGRDGRIPSSTAAGVIGSALVGLVSNNLISITQVLKVKPELNIGEKIKIIDIGERIIGINDGYIVAHYLKVFDEKRLVITISPNFFNLQELLGLSVTDMIEAAKGGTIRIRPFFGEPDSNSSLKSDVFVLMPFISELRPIYDDHIQPVCKNVGLSCRRADDFFQVGQIMHDIWSAISLADWIIADCTGRNPNVFYEMGIAHTMGKRVILIAQNADDVPFDIQHIRFFKYEFTPRGMKNLEDILTAMLTAPI